MLAEGARMRAARFEVVEFRPAGDRLHSIAGMGRNAGTWDSDHSRSAAFRHLAAIRAQYPARVFRVMEV
jgi:hypothetical protein